MCWASGLSRWCRAVSAWRCTDLWLARKLAGLGQPLRAGDVLLTGAQAPIAEVARGERLCLRVAGLGEVACSFA